jgi:hypothetical protein
MFQKLRKGSAYLVAVLPAAGVLLAISAVVYISAAKTAAA